MLPTLLPAVHSDRPGIQDALLLQVHLLQEVQDTTRVCGHAMVRPGPEVVLPDRALCVALKPHRTNFQSQLEYENIWLPERWPFTRLLCSPQSGASGRNVD